MKQHRLPEIKTERLRLRQLRESDWEVVSYLRSDEDVNKFVKRASAESKEKALEFISKINRGFEEQSMYYWVITEKEIDKMIGSICLWHFSEDRKTAEVGYDLHPKFQKQGIMDESLKSVLDFGFKVLNLELIEAYTQQQNEASIKLLERNGFTLIMSRIDEHNSDNRIFEKRKAVD